MFGGEWDNGTYRRQDGFKKLLTYHLYRKPHSASGMVTSVGEKGFSPTDVSDDAT